MSFFPCDVFHNEVSRYSLGKYRQSFSNWQVMLLWIREQKHSFSRFNNRFYKINEQNAYTSKILPRGSVHNLFWKVTLPAIKNSNGPHAVHRPLVLRDCSKCMLGFNQFISTFPSHTTLKHRHGLVQMTLRCTNRTMEPLSLNLNTCDFSAGIYPGRKC
jgi:hypothetical protein